MIIDHRYQYLQPVHYYAQIVSYPIYYVANLPAHIWKKIHYEYASHTKLIKDKNRLYEHNIQLQAQIKHFASLKEENQRLRELLKATDRYTIKRAIIAELVFKNSTPFKQRIKINKGSNDNVYVGQPILGANGILGQIISVTPNNARGMLISDPEHEIFARVARSQTYILVSGTGNPQQLELRNQPLDVDIKEGDLILTTGLDETYPADYPIGTVSEIKQSTSQHLEEIIIKPTASINQGREVLLMWYEPSPNTNANNE